jgi:hypothetical protein
MHRDIVDHISYDRGFNTGHEEGYEKGKKEAWDLMGELADWYKKQLTQQLEEGPVGNQSDIFQKMYLSKTDLATGRYEATLYAQQVIKKGFI